MFFPTDNISLSFRSGKKCGGQIEINYDGKSKRLCPINITTTLMDKFCEDQKCGKHNAKIGTKGKQLVNHDPHSLSVS